MVLAFTMGNMLKVFRVTVELKIIVKAESREAATLLATETARLAERLESLRVTDVYCPADGK